MEIQSNRSRSALITKQKVCGDTRPDYCSIVFFKITRASIDKQRGGVVNKPIECCTTNLRGGCIAIEIGWLLFCKELKVGALIQGVVSSSGKGIATFINCQKRRSNRFKFKSTHIRFARTKFHTKFASINCSKNFIV